MPQAVIGCGLSRTVVDIAAVPTIAGKQSDVTDGLR
jgi:hypothetical protein